MRWRVLLFALGFIIACSNSAGDRTNVADGATCEASKECASGSCIRGYCAGKSCRTSDPSSCDPGWQCTTFKGGLLSSGSVECVPLCGVCPANKHCMPWGSQGTTPCEDGPPRTVTIQGPDLVKIGEKVTFTATVEPPFEKITFATWRLGEEGGKGTELGPGLLSITTELEVNLETEQVLSIEIHGAAGDPAQGTQDYPTAGAMKTIRLACLDEGAVCKQNGNDSSEPQKCCAAGLYCAHSGKPTPSYCTKNK